MKEYFTTLHSKLSSSPHTMEISPDISDLFPDINKSEEEKEIRDPLISLGSSAHSISLSRFIKTRIAMPARRRKTLGVQPWAWSPEQFSLYFNGAIFMVSSEVDKVPLHTDLGHIAREFLTETLAETDMWRCGYGPGPTPIHPSIYLIIYKEIKDSDSINDQTKEVSSFVHGRDLFLCVSEDVNINRFFRSFQSDLFFVLHSFYEARITASQISDSIIKLEEESGNLSELLSEYFEQNSIKRLTGRVPKRIRKLLGRMHQIIHEISTKEVRFADAKKTALERIDRSHFLSKLKPYILDNIDPNSTYDRGAHLTAMNFAAEETSNVVMTQAAIAGGLVGAIVGTIIALVGQGILK